jgi:type IV secretion system protein VirB5
LKTKNPVLLENRYEDKKQQHFDMYLNLSKSLHSWKLAFFSLFILFAITLTITLYLSTRSTLIPYVIEVDKTGNAMAINPAYHVNYFPKEAQEEFFLKELVRNVRSISRDNVLNGRNYKKNLFFLRDNATKKYAQLISDENLTKLVQEGVTRDIKIISTNKLTPNSYQIRWNETVYNHNGDILKIEKIIGIFYFKVKQPKTIKELDNNPLGILVQDFSISKEGD